jgi:hypothetical protein
MPDFERLTDSLRVFAAPDATTREWARGYRAGKTAARWQIVAIAAALALLWLGGAGLHDAWR